MSQRFPRFRYDQQVALANVIKSLAGQLQGLYAAASSKPYQNHFKTLQMACSPLELDPLRLAEHDLTYISLFFVLSRSIHSLDGFWSAIKSIYSLNGLPFPEGKPHKEFKKTLRKMFLAADTVNRAWAMTPEVFRSLILSLDMTIWEDVVVGVWLFMSFVFMLRPEDIHRGRFRWLDVFLCPDGGADVKIYPNKGAAHHGVASFSSPPNAIPQLSLSCWLSALRSLVPGDLVGPKLPILVHISDRFRGQPISTRWFTSRIRSLYLSVFKSDMPSGFSAYSLRRGGATAYYNAGLKDIHLQHLMRHKSLETTQIYINSSDQQSIRRFISTHLLNIVSPS